MTRTFARGVTVMALGTCVSACTRSPPEVDAGSSAVPAPTPAPADAAPPHESARVLAVPADVTLPATRLTNAPPAGALVVIASRTRIALGADGPALAVPDPATWANGLPAQYKEGGAHGLLVRPLADAVASRPGGNGRAVVVADASLPFAIFVEVLFTLGQREMGVVSIAARAPQGAVVAVPVYLPQRGPDGKPTNASALDLTVRMEDGGFAVLTHGQPMAAGCRAPSGAKIKGDASAPVTLPKRGGDYDDAALSACVTALKAANPAETQATLVPQRTSDMKTVVSAMDALRGDRANLFPAVSFGLVH